jgi:hypothetical protein
MLPLFNIAHSCTKRRARVRPLRKLILPISMPGQKGSCRAWAGFWLIGSEKIWDRGAASPSRLWFETEALSQAGNLQGLRRIDRELIARRRPWMDPSEWYSTWTARKFLSTENRSTVPATDIFSQCHHPLVKHARYYWLLLAEGHLNRRRSAAMLGGLTLLPVPTG